MGLIAHFPLNGDTLDYSGNGNHLRLYNATGNLVSSELGKIGKCYERKIINTTDYLRSTNKVSLFSDFTMACWAFVTDTDTTTANGLISNHNHATNTGAGITVGVVSDDVDYRISCSTGTGTSRTYNSYKGTTNIKDSWNHLMLRFVKKINTLELFVNGILEYSMVYLMYCEENYIDVFNWSTNMASSSNYKPACKLNDVRIYDHALSDKEVKELSKAKILHYTFDDFQEPTENLLPEGVREETGNREYLMYTNLSPIFDAHGVGTYTFSFDIKTPVSGSISVYCDDRTANTIEYNYSSMGIYVTEDYQRFTMTRDITLANADATHTSLAFYGTYDSGRIPTVKNVQIEKKDHSTPFVNGSRSGTVKDISGYNNHAELALATSPDWTNDSKIGTGAYKFDGNTNLIAIPNNIQSLKHDAITISFWFFVTSGTQQYSDWGSYIIHNGNVSSVAGSIYTFAMNTSGNITWAWDGNYSAMQSPLAYNDGRWHHTVGTWDGSISKLYIDGTEVKRLNITTNTSGVIGSMYIGKRNGYSRAFKGQIDDVRIYATALSDSDIKELYQTRASLDNQGNLLVSKLEEELNWDGTIQNTNLIFNGNTEQGSNINFPSLTYNSAEQCFTITSGASSFNSSEYIKINGNGLNIFDQYKLDGWFKQPSGTMSRYYYMLVCYDKNKNFIEYKHAYKRAGTETTLSQPLNYGDSYLYLTNISGWYDDGTTTYTHSKQFKIFPSGHDYPDYTYSRITGRYLDVEDGSLRLSLDGAWIGSNYPTGTKICNTNDGSGYSYIGASNALMTTDWEYRSGISSATANAASMRCGTEYVRVGHLINRDAGTVTSYIKNMRFYNISNSGQQTTFPIDKPMINERGIIKQSYFSEVGITNGLIAWYPLNGNTRDYSGNKNDGVAYGATVSSGLNQQCYEFDGVDDWIRTGDIQESLNSTVSIWFKISSFINGARIYWGDASNRWILNISTGNKLQWYCNPDSSSVGYKTSNQSFALNDWNNAVLTYNGGKVNLFLNGARDSVEASITGIFRKYKLNLGTNFNSSNNWFNGKIQDIRIYNRALSEEEIKIQYDLNKGDYIAMKLTADTLYVANQIKEV